MEQDIFFVSIDPHPDGQLRLMHSGGKCEVWDFETTQRALTIRGIINILDHYCAPKKGKATICIYHDVLDFIKGRIFSLRDELEEYENLISDFIYPSKPFIENAAVMSQHNSRRKKKPASDQKPI